MKDVISFAKITFASLWLQHIVLQFSNCKEYRRIRDYINIHDQNARMELERGGTRRCTHVSRGCKQEVVPITTLCLKSKLNLYHFRWKYTQYFSFCFSFFIIISTPYYSFLAWKT